MRTIMVSAATALFLSTGMAQAQRSAADCARAPGPGRIAVQGMVRDSATELPLSQRKVQLFWLDNERRRSQEQQSDHAGEFLFCDAPAGMQLTVETLGTSALVNVAGGGTDRVVLVVTATRTPVGGKVVDAGGRGIAGAEVRVRSSQLLAVTRADGTFQLTDLPVGVHWLDVSHVAYEARHDSVRIEPNVRMQLTIRLAQSVIALPPIEVEVRSAVLERAGFYERRQRMPGTFLSRHEWGERTPRMASDLLRTVPGVRLQSIRGSAGSAALDRSSCAFRYVMDGTRIGATFNLDDIPVDWIEAIEVYSGASQVPAAFAFPTSQPRANCGVIVIWTRGAR